MQTYLQIKCAISKFEHLYWNKLLFLTLRQCANICLLRSIYHILKILFTTKEQMVDIECNTRGQSQSKLWFHEQRGRLTASCTFWYSNEMKRKCFSSHHVLAKSFCQQVICYKAPRNRSSGATVMSRLPLKNIWSKKNFDDLIVTA